MQQLLATVEALPNGVGNTSNIGGLDYARNGYGGDDDIHDDDDDIESEGDEDGADGAQGGNREESASTGEKDVKVLSPSIIRYTSLGPVGVKDLKAADVRAGVASLTTLRGLRGSSSSSSSSSRNPASWCGTRLTSRDNSSNFGLPSTSSNGGASGENTLYSRSDVHQPAPESVSSAALCSTAVLTASQDDMSDAFLLTSMSQGSSVSQSFGVETSLSQDSVLQPSQE